MTHLHDSETPATVTRLKVATGGRGVDEAGRYAINTIFRSRRSVTNATALKGIDEGTITDEPHPGYRSSSHGRRKKQAIHYFPSFDEGD